MSKISGKETKPEIIVRKYVFSKGFRYRKNESKLPGKPDIVLSKYKTVIFVNGCFWHGHENCRAAKLPETNREFWKGKIGDTMKRDSINYKRLVADGWKVVVVWQCELKNKSSRENRLDNLVKEIEPHYE